jgi:Domain of unknown function (DUF4259)
MGAWSKDSFRNDTACNWAYGLEDATDLSLVRETIKKVVESGDDYLEAPDAEEAIAAVEVIARLKGNFGQRDSYTETTDNWVKAHPQQPPPDLVASGTQALDRILRPPSELLELWQESGELEDWKSSVLDLRARANR